MSDLAYFMHCIILLLAHIWLLYPLGHVYTEPELEVQGEQPQTEELTNLAWINASPGASHQYLLTFDFQSIFIIQYDCALSL
jgi:hypothetical protein